MGHQVEVALYQNAERGLFRNGVVRFSHLNCEAMNLLQAPKPRKNKALFSRILTYFGPAFRISREPTFDLFFPYFNFLGGFGACSRFVASQHLNPQEPRKP